MAQSLSSILIHLVFSTKNREPFLTPQIETELYPFLSSIFAQEKSPLITANGTSDHVHCLFKLARTKSVSEVVEAVKSTSSNWLKQYSPSFYWQRGYGSFSIGESGVKSLKFYIANQKIHHQTRSFQDEYRSILTKYEIPIDEKFVWD